jgi:hypothetical protein
MTLLGKVMVMCLVWFEDLNFLPEVAWLGWSCVSSPAPYWKSSCAGQVERQPTGSQIRTTENNMIFKGIVSTDFKSLLGLIVKFNSLQQCCGSGSSRIWIFLVGSNQDSDFHK